MVANNGNSNTYEETRKQRLDENKKRLEESGILDISKSLSKLSTPEKKPKPRLPKSRAANTEVTPPRRSSRSQTTVTSYEDDLDIDLPHMRKKTRFSSPSSKIYVARPLDKVKLASDEDRSRALRAAEECQTSLQSGKPSFVKSMLQSHVYRGFWLGLPSQFCKDHLSKTDVDMILEDENGSTYDARYLGSKSGLSGGWRGFALDHKLDDGDAVVFELVESNKFKVYTFKVSSPLPSNTEANGAEEEGSYQANCASKDQNKQLSKKANASKVLNFETSESLDKSATEMISGDEKNGIIEEAVGKGKLAAKKEVESVEKNEKQKSQAFKPRKKPAPRLFRRRV